MFDRYEIFNPIDGEPVARVRGALVARALCYLSGKLRGEWLDFARPGEGWTA